MSQFKIMKRCRGKINANIIRKTPMRTKAYGEKYPNKSKNNSKWIQHVQEIKSLYPNKTYKEILKLSSDSWKK